MCGEAVRFQAFAHGAKPPIDHAVHESTLRVTGTSSATETLTDIAHHVGRRRTKKSVPSTVKTATQYRAMTGATKFVPM